MNVKFYRLSSLNTWSETYRGIFVHLTADQRSGETIVHKAGLYFGGESDWEYLTNDTAAISDAITAAINALDVSTDKGAASISGSTITINAVQQEDGLIKDGGSTTINLDGTYDATDNKIATKSTVTTAINALDGSHNVVTISDAPSGTTVYAKKVEFFDATQTDGVIATDSSASDTLYISKAVTTTNPIITKDDLSGIVGAMVYKGVVNIDIGLPSSDVQAGWTYVVATAGTYAGQACEVGDMIIAKDSTPTWNIISGENQVTNADLTIVAGAGTSSIIATVDGTEITAKVSVTAGSATIASKSGDIVTLKTGVTQGTNTGTITNDSGTDIFLAAVASTGEADDVTYSIGQSSGITPIEQGGTTATVQEAITQLDSRITSAGITIDGQVGGITTGNGIATLTSNIKVIELDLDNTNANGLYLSGETNGQKKLAMAKATGSTFGTVEVTTGNGLTLTDGVVAYEHNTTAITVASKSNGVVTINGILTPNESDAITTSGAITLAKVATTGAAEDVSYAGTTDVTGSEPATVEAALDDLYSKVNTLQSTHTVVAGSNSVGVTSGTSGNTTTYTVDLVWRESLA